MKKILIVLLIVMAAGGGWIGRMAWRAHKNLVTLDVRNAPLAEVIRSIERQTRETIHVDKRLEGPVTLKLKNAPLAEALDRVADEVGARAQLIHAVHRSDFMLRQLKNSLREGGKLGEVGWTNLAPRSVGGDGLMDLATLDSSGGAHSNHAGTGQPITMNVNGGELNPSEIEAEIRKQLSAQGLDKLIPESAIAGALQQARTGGHSPVMVGQPRVRVVRMGADGKMSSSDGSNLPPEIQEMLAKGNLGSGGGQIMGQMKVSARGKDGKVVPIETDLLTPERVVIETLLDEQFPAPTPVTPGRASAEAAASRVNGRCATFYTLQRSELPVMVGRFLGPRPGHMPALGTNVPSLDPANLADHLSQEVRRERAESYQNLTPEQRARRARNKAPGMVP